MSPILTRPVREQLEHDRVIRQLQARYKRKNEVVINPGNEQNQSVTVGELVVFPDLLLFAEAAAGCWGPWKSRRASRSTRIEARAEWGVYSKLKVPLHLYVPPACVDAVKRICAEYQILVSEFWTYTSSFDQVRFTMVHRSPEAPKPAPGPIPKVAAKPKPAVQAKAVAKPEPKVAKPAVGKAPPVKAAPVKPTIKPVVKAVTKAVAPAKAALKPAKVVAKPVAKPVAKAAVKSAAKAKPVKPVAKVVAAKKRR